jgi:hypothetical protein
MASALMQGITRPAPLPVAAQTAPNSHIEPWRWSRTIAGREPRSAQTRVSEPFCPTLASSWNQTSMGLPAASAGNSAVSSAAKFF